MKGQPACTPTKTSMTQKQKATNNIRWAKLKCKSKAKQTKQWCWPSSVQFNAILKASLVRTALAQAPSNDLPCQFQQGLIYLVSALCFLSPGSIVPSKLCSHLEKASCWNRFEIPLQRKILFKLHLQQCINNSISIYSNKTVLYAPRSRVFADPDFDEVSLKGVWGWPQDSNLNIWDAVGLTNC